MTEPTLPAGNLTSTMSLAEEHKSVAQLITGFSRNCCPVCRSENLLIKALVPSEKLMIFLTGKRKYRCKDCGSGFRMPDRRRPEREREQVLTAMPRVY